MFKLTVQEVSALSICLEGFLFGKIVSISCALTCTLAKEVRLFPGQDSIHPIFTMRRDRVQNGNQSFLCSLFLSTFYLWPALSLIY